jgi:hypothetical protein
LGGCGQAIIKGDEGECSRLELGAYHRCRKLKRIAGTQRVDAKDATCLGPQALTRLNLAPPDLEVCQPLKCACHGGRAEPVTLQAR